MRPDGEKTSSEDFWFKLAGVFLATWFLSNLVINRIEAMPTNLDRCMDRYSEFALSARNTDAPLSAAAEGRLALVAIRTCTGNGSGS
jgi:hypothetical protein